jgi:RluA family pseudouridine synthase
MVDVLLERADLVAINKPEGLATIPGGGARSECLLSAAEAQLGSRLYVVHRLDKETSGVVVFARDPEGHRRLNAEFAGRRAAKEYLALLQGTVAGEAGEIRGPLREFGSGRVGVDARKGRESLTRYEVEERLGGYTLVRAYPETGRRHQLRAHFYSLGHPIAGDPRYGPREAQAAVPRLMLHAHRISLRAPSGEEIAVEAPLPETFRRVIEGIRTRKAPGETGAAGGKDDRLHV